VHQEGPGGLGVGDFGDVFLGGVVKEGGVVAARELGEELAPGEAVLLRKIRHLKEGGLGVEEEEPVSKAVQVVRQGPLGETARPPPVQDVLQAAGAHKGPVEHGQEKAVQGGLLQRRRGFYAGNVVGLEEGLSKPHLVHPSFPEHGDPGFLQKRKLLLASPFIPRLLHAFPFIPPLPDNPCWV
jgi:hypothetical protein